MHFTTRKESQKRARRTLLNAVDGQRETVLPLATQFSLAMLGAFGAWSSPVHAANECGAPAGVAPTVNCTDAAQNPYALGITYSIATGLTLDVSSSIAMHRASGVGFHGIRVDGTGVDPLRVRIADGASITVDGDKSQGVFVTSSNGSSVFIESGANITGATPAVGFVPTPTTGLFGQTAGALNAGSVEISQTAGSQITGSGSSSTGIYGLADGLGAVTLRSAGRINVTGDSAYGMNGLVNNAASLANVGLSLAQTGQISVAGDDGAGMYALTYGLGAARIEVAGTITVSGTAANGVLAYVDNAASTAQASAELASTASVTTSGANGKGVRALQDGFGAASLLSYGAVHTSGPDAHGLDLQVSAAGNTALHTVQLAGNATVDTVGASSHGIRATVAGAAQLSVNLLDAARIDTSGVTSNGVDAAALGVGGTAAVSMGAASSITVTGGQSFGASIRADRSSTMDLQGRLGATGEYGAGIYASSVADTAAVNVRAGASVTGGWQATAAGVGAATALPSAGVILGAGTSSSLTNLGAIGAGADRAILDATRYAVASGNMSINNSGTITGFVELAAGGTNAFNNAATGLFDIRHFADTNGDGVRDTKRIAVSDFGTAATSVLGNMGTVRLASVTGAANVDAAGYYVPTTGFNSVSLDAGFYRLDREGVVQGQFTNLGQFRNSGILDLRGSAVGNSLVVTSNAAAGGAAGHAAFISDGGHLYLNTVLNDGINSHSDVLVVDSTRLGTAPTSIHVGVDASSAGGLTQGNGIQLVEVRDKAASAAGVFALAGRVSSGAFDYQLQHNGIGADAADGNWYLRNTLALAPGGIGIALPNYRAETPVYMAVPAMTSRLGLAMLGNYHDRLGEDRVFEKERAPDADVRPAWGRLFGNTGETGRRGGDAAGQMNSFMKQGPSYDYNLWGLQLGMDLSRDIKADGAFDTSGLYLGLGGLNGTVDAVLGGKAGGTKLDSYSLGAYWSRKAGDGKYIDAVYQASYYKGYAYSTQGESLRTRGWGHAASIEGGVPYTLAEGWALEPQAQLIYQRIGLDSGQDSFARVDFDRNNAFYARLGARLTRDSTSGEQPGLSWARFNVWHHFGAKAQTTFSNMSGQNAVQLQTALGTTWGQLQLGHSSRLTKNASAFVSLDYSFSLDSTKGHDLGGRVGFKLVW